MTVSVVTISILDTFEPNSKMLISTLTRKVLL